MEPWFNTAHYLGHIMGLGMEVIDEVRKQKMISIVIPAYNEEGSIIYLYDKLTEVLQNEQYELIFVDDGSTDNTLRELKRLNNVRIISFQRNYGKSAALQAGFEAARGGIIIQMDADLQDDPLDIPKFLLALDRGHDMVNGWRVDRKDSLQKRIVSKIYNVLTSKIVGLKLHDYNCGFKAYKRKVIEHLNIYGEQHRYIPALVCFNGFKVGEIQVRHHKRKYGKTKYSTSRIFNGFMDLLTVKYLQSYGRRPLHFFGMLSIIPFILGVLASLYLIYIKFTQDVAIGERPILMLAVLLLVIGVQFISLGLLSEMISKESRKKGYIIKETKL